MLDDERDSLDAVEEVIAFEHFLADRIRRPQDVVHLPAP